MQDLTAFIEQLHKHKGNKKFNKCNSKMKSILNKLAVIVKKHIFVKWKEVNDKFMELYELCYLW